MGYRYDYIVQEYEIRDGKVVQIVTELDDFEVYNIFPEEISWDERDLHVLGVSQWGDVPEFYRNKAKLDHTKIYRVLRLGEEQLDIVVFTFHAKRVNTKQVQLSLAFPVLPIEDMQQTVELVV